MKLSPSGAYEVSLRVRLKVPYDHSVARSIHPGCGSPVFQTVEIRHDVRFFCFEYYNSIITAIFLPLSQNVHNYMMLK